LPTSRCHLEHDRTQITTLLAAADTTHGELVLERLPSGECVWLKPEDNEPRYVLTDQGRRDLAMHALFGPWPSVAEACA
jgi:hypothetical protein